MTTLNRSHQSVLFVRVTENDSDAYRNRANALVGSLNRSPDFADGGTIKVDVYSVNDITGAITPGLTWPTPEPTVDTEALRVKAAAAGFDLVAKPKAPKAGRPSSPRLRALAEDAGYVQSIVVEPNAKEKVAKAASTGWAITAIVWEDDYEDDEDDCEYCR